MRSEPELQTFHKCNTSNQNTKLYVAVNKLCVYSLNSVS